ncbi:MAG: phosphatidylserine decarboxylase family protein [Desulfovibrio sp.]|nr:phosphatidylserine decarboxylase family protein [Desulfovibrio sp.]
MRPPSFSVCREGASAIGFCAFSALVFAFLDWPVPALVFWILTFFCLHFFRDPARVVPRGPGLAVSPADGTILKIESREDPLTGQTRQRVCVFMSVFNVHVNRSPVAGTVENIRYWPGKFFNASFDKASTDNERCAYLIKDEAGKDWTMVQIAGLIARRIVCRADIGDKLDRGERLGMIRFGSRVDLYLPEGYAPAVRDGEEVLGGQTVIARKV